MEVRYMSDIKVLYLNGTKVRMIDLYNAECELIQIRFIRANVLSRPREVEA